MKAAVLYEVRQPLRIEEIEVPEVSDDDVLIKVAVCGVCHTDLKVVEGRTRFTPPTVLGREVAGTVERVWGATRAVVSAVVICLGLSAGWAAEERPIDVIEDNSFLIEEAYNQEAGVVQHIFNAVYTNDSRHRGWSFNFTQEWPMFSQDHQFSYTIPSYHIVEGADRVYGVGDIQLNYRYQALYEGGMLPAFSPRFSLILPTGSRDRGTGNNVVGYQWNLPFSKKVASRFATHANFGLTYLPHVRAPMAAGQLSPRRSLVSYNIGASGIFALLPRLHLMLEWVGIFDESINDAGRSERAFKPTISPGLRAAVVNEEKLQVVVGAAAPVGLNRKADNHGAFLYLSIEHDLF